MFIWLTFCHHLCIGVWSQLTTIAVGYVEYRQVHHVAFEKSDLFFLCILRPLSSIITKQDSEIAAAQVHDIPLSIQLESCRSMYGWSVFDRGKLSMEHFFSNVERDVLLVVDLHWHNMSLVMCLWCWCAVDAFGRVQSTTVFPESHYVEENAWCLHFECTRTL